MYRRPNFETSLRQWTNRQRFDNIMTDIYDSETWQTLKESSQEDSANSFRNEVANSHLRLMLNFD